MQLNRKKLTPKYRQILEYAEGASPQSDILLLMSALNSTVAQLATYRRVVVPGRGGNVPVNYYGIVLASSGAGKTSSSSFFEKMIAEVVDTWEKKASSYFSLEDMKKIKKGIRAASAASPIAAAGTPEGFFWNQYLFKLMGEGSLLTIRDEAVNVFKKDDTPELEGLWKESFDEGNLNKSLTKQHAGERVRGVPHNLLMMSAVSSLLSDERLMQTFENFLADGFARRCFCVFIERKRRKHRLRPIDDAVARQKAVELLEGMDLLELGMKIEIPEEVQEVIWKFQDDCEDNSQDELKFPRKLFREIEEHRSWKTIKFAGAIAALEHPEDPVIRMADWDAARYMDDVFSPGFFRFFMQKTETLASKIFDFLQRNGASSAPDIQAGVRGMQRVKGRNFNDEMAMVDEYATGQGFTLDISKITKPQGRPITKYSIVKPGEAQTEELPLTIPKTKDYKIQCSIGHKNAAGFVKMKLAIPEFLAIIQTKIPVVEINEFNNNLPRYAAGAFKDSHRCAENFLGGANAIILDIDSKKKNLSIEDFKKRTDGIACIIHPTRSHLSEKSDGNDRFRVIFPTTKISFKENERFKRMIRAIIDHFSLGEFADKAAVEVARYYFPSQHKAEIVSGDFLNWERFDTPEPERKISTAFRSEYTGEKKNVNPALEWFWKDFQYLAPGEKKSRVKCPQHDDKNPSAAVWRNEDGDQCLRLWCSTCAKTTWEK